jgi:hypothetical protein
MNKKSLCFYVALSLAAIPCFAATSSWNGTWKLNVAKSKLTGDTYTVEAKANGLMHYSNGSTIAYDFACNGKPYPVIADRTMSCTGSPNTGYDYVDRAGDKVLGKSHDTLSADNKTLTTHGTNIKPDGTTSNYTDVYKRLSGTNGLAGKWMNVKSQGASGTMVIETKPDWIKITYPDYKETSENKLDGSSASITGPDIPPGVSTSLKAEGPNKIHYAVAYNGKTLSEGTRTLSADGRTLVEEEWAPGKMNEKATLVYERQ